MVDTINTRRVLLLEKSDLDALRFVQKVLPLPSIVLSGFVVYLSSRPWWSSLLIVVFIGGNVGMTWVATRRERSFGPHANEVRFAVNAGLLLGIGSVSGPDCPSILMAVPALCAVPFLFRDWRAWVGISGMIAAAGIGNYAGGADFLELVPIAIAEVSVGVVLVAAVFQLQRRGADLEVALEKASRAARVKSEFLAVMSHEVRTPLHGMMGTLSLLESMPTTDEIRDKLSIMSRCNRDMLRVLTDILDFSQLQSGQAQFEFKSFEVLALVDGVVERARTQAQDLTHDIECSSEIEAGVCAWYHGPHRPLVQVLDRLVENAVAFTSQGAVTVRVETSAEGLRFEVRDTGSGIAEQKFEEIFDAFTQIDSTTTRAHGGVGIGLAICKRIIEVLDGEIGVDSREAHGSRFWFTIPCRAVTAEQEREREQGGADAEVVLAPEPPELRPTDLWILAVDDSEINRRVIGAMLRRLGYRVDTAAHGREAVEQSGEKFYPIILMDCYMPVMDGYEATRAIRARDGRRSCIIGVTADVQSTARERCMEAGMDDYMPKPVSLGQLRDRLALEHQRARPS